jgi:hypothetical protein
MGTAVVDGVYLPIDIEQRDCVAAHDAPQPFTGLHVIHIGGRFKLQLTHGCHLISRT